MQSALQIVQKAVERLHKSQNWQSSNTQILQSNTKQQLPSKQSPKILLTEIKLFPVLNYRNILLNTKYFIEILKCWNFLFSKWGFMWEILPFFSETTNIMYFKIQYFSMEVVSKFQYEKTINCDLNANLWFLEKFIFWPRKPTIYKAGKTSLEF